MTDEPELPRLLDSDDAPAELRAALEGLQAHVPTLAQMAALSDRLGIDRMAAGPSPSPASAKSALLTKGALGVGAAVGGVALLLLLRSGEPKQAQHTEQPRGATSVAASTAAVAEPPGATGRGAAPAEALPNAAAPVGSISGSGPLPPPNTERTNGRGPSKPPATPPSAGEKWSGNEPASPTAAGRSPSKPMAPTGSSKPAPLEQQQNGVSEIDLLRDARATLPVDPGEALAITERHRTAFPRGALVQEREILAITALVKLGRPDAAQKRAEQFRSAYPKSAYLIQLERILPKP